MNPQVTSREAILAQCRQLVTAQGMPAVNMRSVAAACGVALGSLYNYFPSKAHLIAATVESVWDDIFGSQEASLGFASFLQAVSWMAERLQQGSAAYPGFFTLHAMSFARQDRAGGRQLMQQHMQRIKAILRDALHQDPAISKVVFTADFTPEGLIDLVFDAVIAAALQGGDSGSLQGLLRLAFYQDKTG